MVKRRLLGGIALSFALTTVIAVEPPTTVILGTPPQPGWIQLTIQQKEVLAPLAKDWDKMENIQKKKWLGIADRFPRLQQVDQQRMQDRMREWASLTPEQRAKIRSSYKDFNQLPPEQKKVVKQKWDAYSNLPPEQQQRLREGGKSSKLLIAAPAEDMTTTTGTGPAVVTPTTPESTKH